MPTDAVTLQITSVVAYLALTAGGVIVWLRRRSMASVLVGVGFFSLLIRELAALADYFHFKALLRGSGSGSDTFFFVQHHTAVQILGALGACAAGSGLFWHALSLRATSPNQHLERP